MNKPYFCWNFFLTDWRHKRLKNTIDLLLFYREHFYGFSESGLETRAVLIQISVMLKFTERPKTPGITSKKHGFPYKK